MKKTSKYISALMCALLFLSLGSLNVSAAADYTNGAGSVRVVCGSYKKTFDAKKYNNNFSLALNAALENAGKKASASRTARVTVSKGFYSLDRTIKVHSNTVLDASGCYFRYCGNMLRNAFDNSKTEGYGYTSASNITIKGGEWEQLVDFKYAGDSDMSKMHSNFRFAHMSNLTVKNAVFKNNYNCHDIELAGVSGAKIHSNFLYNDKSVNGISNNGGRESIQIDVNTSDAMPYFPSYDKTPCENIDIHDNYFRNKFRAVGSHHAVLGSPFDNIKVHGNFLENIGGIGVYAVYWTNSKIYDNIMYNVGLGIDMRNMTSGSALNFLNLNKLSYKACDAVAADSRTYIYGNDIRLRVENNTFTRECGIRVLGDRYSSTDPVTGTKAGVYKIYNVNIGVSEGGKSIPNIIRGNLAVGIQLNYGVNSRIVNNHIEMQESAAATANGIELKGSQNSVIENNTVLNGMTDGAKGIFLTSAAGSVRNSEVLLSYNKVENFKHSGVYVQNSDGVKLEENKVILCGEASLNIDNSNRLSVFGNSFTADYYGVSITQKCSDIELKQNSITNPDTAVYSFGADNLILSENYITAMGDAVYIKNTASALIEKNDIYSGIYGVKIGKNCPSTSITENKIFSSDECVYYNGSSSKDKTEQKSLVIFKNALDTPDTIAGVRAVYDNLLVEIHENYKSGGTQPFYRFKGDSQSTYTYFYFEPSLYSLNYLTDGENDYLTWLAGENASSYRIFKNTEYLTDTTETAFTTSSSVSQLYSVVPLNTCGNIMVSGMPLYVNGNE